MPTRRHYANSAPRQTTQAQLTSGVGNLVVADSFAGWPTQFPFHATLDLGTAAEEIVLVTAIVGATASITRGQDGTPAIAHQAGATFDVTVVALDFDEANAHTSANSGVHGTVGSVVGTTDVQTLTNKTLSAPALADADLTGVVDASTATSVTLPATVAASLSVTGHLSQGGVGVPPTGSIVMFAAATVPAGWLAADGSAVSRTTYASLFAVLGTAYGVGDGTTTFNVPNLTSKFPYGATPGATGGAATHTHTAPAHTHSISAHTHGLGSGFAQIAFIEGKIYQDRQTANFHYTSRSAQLGSGDFVEGTAGSSTALFGNTESGGSGASGSSGGSATTASSSLPPYLGLSFIIKF